ncbi:MAG: FkbM family methyltransferase, partial [Candidatus Omnitrophica bacterium]|nr:FkbM family methyltransferase [Candidatus Omnitrophota bacterium]
GDTVLDIGAHIGLFTLVMAREVGPKGRVFSFEPCPESHHLLAENIRTNGLSNVTLVEAAVGEETGWTTLFLNPLNSGDHRTHPTSQSGESVRVETIRLDDFRLRTYPGGSSPMSYESDVTVAYAEENSNVQKEVLIQMNEPMDQNGFRVFQSSFIDQPKGDPRISIFSIAKDPGVPIIYTGSIVLCVGIAMMFYGRKYLRKLEKKWYPQRMSGAAS